jgi:DNA-binding CsgD family transcriptional regulator
MHYLPVKIKCFSPTLLVRMKLGTIGKFTGYKRLMSSGKTTQSTSLSQRELEILELVATGLTNHDIAEKLEISKRTVDNHISNILTKTKTDNRIELMRWALQWGKICIDEVNCCILPNTSDSP